MTQYWQNEATGSFEVRNGRTLLETRETDQQLSFKVPSIDKLMKGGLRKRGINEIYGEAGSGKTQLCLHLSIAAQISHADGAKAVYINTEGPFPINRLNQIAISLKQQFGERSDDSNWMDKVLYFSVFDIGPLIVLLKQKLPLLLKSQRIVLLVIDSVAAVLRIEDDYTERANKMRNIASILAYLGEKYDFAVLCVNQATARLDEDKFAPALGLVWSNVLTTRFLVYRQGEKRKIKVIFSPNMAPAEAEFCVTNNGIESN